MGDCPSIRPSVCVSFKRFHFRITPLTIFIWLTWNFVDALYESCRCAYGVCFQILMTLGWVMALDLVTIVTFSHFWITPPTVLIRLTWNWVAALLVRCRCACAFSFEIWQLLTREMAFECVKIVNSDHFLITTSTVFFIWLNGNLVDILLVMCSCACGWCVEVCQF